MKEFSKQELELLETLLRDFILGNPRLFRTWGQNEEARELHRHVQESREVATTAGGSKAKGI